MLLGMTYEHISQPFSCVPTEDTSKGVKVQMSAYYPNKPRKAPKVTTAYVQAIDYDLWKVKK